MRDFLKRKKPRMGWESNSLGKKVEIKKEGDHSYVLIFKKEPEGKEKRGHHDGRGKRTPSSLNLAPTIFQPRTSSWIAHNG